MAIDMERLRKLLLVVLSSDQAGEVMSASAAIAKLLKKDGKDIHWLVAQAAGERPRMVPGTKPGTPYPKPTYYGAPTLHWLDKLVYCVAHVELLQHKQREFIMSLGLQLAEKKSWQPSVAQQSWLDDIYKKLKHLETYGTV